MRRRMHAQTGEEGQEGHRRVHGNGGGRACRGISCGACPASMGRAAIRPFSPTSFES